jgi:hypothetical protein
MFQNSGDGHTMHILKGQKIIYSRDVVANCSGVLKESNELIKRSTNLFITSNAAKLEGRRLIIPYRISKPPFGFYHLVVCSRSGDGHTILSLKAQKIIYSRDVVSNFSGALKKSNKLIKKKSLLILNE